MERVIDWELTSPEHLMEFRQTVFGVNAGKDAICRSRREDRRVGVRLYYCAAVTICADRSRDAILADESETMSPRDLHTRRFTSLISGRVAKLLTVALLARANSRESARDHTTEELLYRTDIYERNDRLLQRISFSSAPKVVS